MKMVCSFLKVSRRAQRQFVARESSANPPPTKLTPWVYFRTSFRASLYNCWFACETQKHLLVAPTDPSAFSKQRGPHGSPEPVTGSPGCGRVLIPKTHPPVYGGGCSFLSQRLQCAAPRDDLVEHLIDRLLMPDIRLEDVEVFKVVKQGEQHLIAHGRDLHFGQH
jgi:hypothetical protein